MVSQKYRWDFIGLSTDEKPTSETSDKVVNGSTYYCSDTSKLYVYCDGTWYERKPLGGGGGGGGTSDFNDLSNRPKYNGSDMTGSTNIPEVKTYTAGSNVAISDQNVISATDTTYSAFTGTDGTTAGEAGLVPAPATTDAGKFLKADGTWDTVGGGGGSIKALTSADNNWPTNNPTGIALWKLEPGIYRKGENGLNIWFCSGNSQSQANQQVDGNWIFYQGLFIVRPGIWNGNPDSNLVDIMAFSNDTTSKYAYLQWKIDNTVQDGYYAGALKAAVEKEFIPITGTAAPTTSTPATYIGQIFVDTVNDDAYICLDTTPGNSIWKKITP